MGTHGPKFLRKTTNVVLDALLQAAERAYGGRPVAVEALHEIVQGLKNSAQFDPFYTQSFHELSKIVDGEKLSNQRQHAFGRLMLHPLSHALDQGPLNRDMLPNIFSFFHLVLGEDAETYASRSQDIVKGLRDELGEDFTWDAFYLDPDARIIQWHTLVRIAQSFKRWDVRKDWFMKLMQYTPTSVSVGPSAFVMREIDHDEEPKLFTNREFCIFFRGLFSSLDELTANEEKAFAKEFGQPPHHLIGQFLLHLAACDANEG